MAAIWGSVIGGGLGLAGSLLGDDEQTTTQQYTPSGYLTGKWGTPDLLWRAANFTDPKSGVLNWGKGKDRDPLKGIYNYGMGGGSPLTGAGASYIQNILNGGGVSGVSNPYLNAQNTGVTGNTLGTASSIIGGQGLNPDTNPWLKQTFNRAADLTRGRLASEFAGGGRDLAASAPARSEELQTLSGAIYGGNYGAERDRQAGLLGQSLGLGQQNLANQRGIYNQGMGMGLNQQMSALGMGLPYANQPYVDWGQALNAAYSPVDKLIDRTARLAGPAGGVTTGTQSLYSDPMSAAMGGAMMGGWMGGYGKDKGWWG